LEASFHSGQTESSSDIDLNLMQIVAFNKAARLTDCQHRFRCGDQQAKAGDGNKTSFAKQLPLAFE
jgi:hypothetical protein